MIQTLVTFRASFIGSHVARHCLAMGYAAIALDDLSDGFEDHAQQDVRYIKGQRP
ncbi:MAG TPA: hypothetical protein VF622_12695 [Segetibacter sp.]|jgi:UDP-glucose 4-epimerase